MVIKAWIKVAILLFVVEVALYQIGDVALGFVNHPWGSIQFIAIIGLFGSAVLGFCLALAALFYVVGVLITWANVLGTTGPAKKIMEQLDLIGYKIEDFLTWVFTDSVLFKTDQELAEETADEIAKRMDLNPPK